MDFVDQYLDSFFVSLTGCLVNGMALGHEIGKNVFQLVDGRTCHIADVCSGSRLFVTLVAISIFRLVSKPKDRLTWAMLAATPIVVGVFNVIRCMVVAQRSIAVHDYAGFALFAIPVLFYAMRPDIIIQNRAAQAVALSLFSAICTWAATPAYANETKPPATPITVYTDEYVVNNGSRLTNSNETFYAKWTYSSQVPPTALLHVAVRDKGQEEAVWEDIAMIQIGLLEAEIYIGEGGELLDYFMYVDYVPPAPVHTNGVYMFYMEHPKSMVSNRWITIKSEVRKDNIKIMPHPREER